MRTFVTATTFALAVALGAPVASAQPAQPFGWDSFLSIDGASGPSQGFGHAGWFDVTHHEIHVAEEAPQCTIIVDVPLRDRAPGIADSVGLDFAEMTLELTNAPVSVYYRARMTGVHLRKVITQSDEDSKAHERLEMTAEAVRLEVSEVKGNGSLGPPRIRDLDCGSR